MMTIGRWWLFLLKGYIYISFLYWNDFVFLIFIGLLLFLVLRGSASLDILLLYIWPMISATYHLMCQYANMLRNCDCSWFRFFPLAHLKDIAVVRHTLSYSVIFFCTAHTRWAQQATVPGYSTILLRPALLPAQLSTSRSGCQWRQDWEANFKQIHKPMVEHNQEQLLFEFWEGCHGAKVEK